KAPTHPSSMLEAGLPPEVDPALREAGARAFAVLRKASETLCAMLPPGGRPPALMMALHVWALSHGIASLFGRGDDGARRKLPMSAEELLEAGVLVYLARLGLPGGKGPHAPSPEFPEIDLTTGGPGSIYVNVKTINMRMPRWTSPRKAMTWETPPGSRS